ncbi:pyruvate kinase [Tianweitania populi]|uniref:Pyruvate kinase n=1 Tax=Tianweitania populi TaxID=1607949 RepID=A0A8J3DZG4_9HYPH|nr:pyruvate kinase [Tianweitania populi]GHD24455.1 pyruvate kinase [Tianweitania populi]
MRQVGDVFSDLAKLREQVSQDGNRIADRWRPQVERTAFVPSVENLANYLAFRRHDIRPLQRDLTALGLSSLGRAEAHVMPTLDAVHTVLHALTEGSPFARQDEASFFGGETRLAERSGELFGERSPHSPVSLLVTLPSEAADQPELLQQLAELGVEAVRINCAHDDEDVWLRMIENVREAHAETGRRMRVFMDLAGPKIRTGDTRKGKNGNRVHTGDEFAIALPGQLKKVTKDLPALECTLPEAVRAAEVGNRISIDDGKLDVRVTRCEAWGIVVAVVAGGGDEKGYKLKSEKGINFPDTDLDVPALTQTDREHLVFAAHHADAIEFSFVQTRGDILQLQDALRGERPDDWQQVGLVLKIETSRAVKNLPDLIVQAAGQQPTAVMIARGDLAVQIGFARLAEIQEEILWLAEAAHVPVIWATQVLESFLKTGVPSRGEMTDAAMGARAECVMLNKGPHLLKAIPELDKLFGRMSEHMSKKTPQLRALQSWDAFAREHGAA